jgi:mevalonate kinase
MSIRFDIPSKCILSGEHSVLRGGYALVVPVFSRKLSLTYTPSDIFKIDFSGERGKEMQLAFLPALDRALDAVAKTRDDLKGVIEIQNEVPIGSGLGASAVICVSIARLFHAWGWLREVEMFSFARNLENLFHGESSGLDIAVVLEGQPLKYHRERGVETLSWKWHPNWYISYSGARGLTADCVNQVKKYLAENPSEGLKIDEEMKESVRLIETALTSDERVGQPILLEGLKLGKTCFEKWNLLSPNLREHIGSLESKGALVAKPTGSGLGGFVLSLWPPNHLPQGSDFISL